MDDPSPAGGHDARARLDRTDRTPARARRRAPPTTTRPSSGRATTSGPTGCSRATSGCGRATSASVRRSPSGSAGSTRRPISPSGSRASRGSAMRSSTRATRPSSWPAWAAAASPPTSSAGRSAASRATSTLRILDSTDPAYVVGDARRPRSAPDARHHRLEVGHDDRAERLPRLRLGARRGGARADPPPSLRGARRVLRGDHRPRPQRRGHRPPRRLPRGVHQPARHRRPLLGADLRRPRAGVAHRDRPRRAARLGLGDAGRLPRAGPGASTRASRSASRSGRWPRPAATS